ncbi:hypothetical protein D9O29_07585 [Pantoea vagans]|uniref:Uncharacterized protein n=1 Tax=Pantoea vagans TaxID=470934 RepID=A0ABY3LJU6_9GAMM|nr:hypothetical protein D9O29_07585 [Pantoea vagans]
MPPGHVLIANLPPLADNDVSTYKFGWDVGDSLALQRSWEKIDPVRRAQFKVVSGTRNVIVGGQTRRENTTRVNDSILQTLTDLSELDRLPCLMTLETAHSTPGLMAYIRQHPFINELHWQSAVVSAIDVAATRLSRLILNPKGVSHVRLNPDLALLSLTATPSSDLQVETHQEGRNLCLQCSLGLPLLQGLDRLGALSLTGVRAIDLAPVVERFPCLTELRLWGNPGVVSQMQIVAALPLLQMLTLSNIFGFSAVDFPRPGQLPNLSSLWMTSVPSDLVSYVRIAYKQATTLGLDLSLSKARKPEWLTENLHNPFRDWDGREHISATHARKAALAYKNLRTATQNITSNMDVAALLTAAVTAYTEAFNLIDRRSKAIETVEREEIYSVLFDVLNPLEQKLGEQGASLVNQSRLYQLFDQIRGF